MYSTIVVGIHKVDSARAAAAEARKLATLCHATLHLVAAYDDEADRTRVEEFLHATAAQCTGPTELHVMQGDPARAILQVATEVGADLVAVGNKGMHGARRVLGSVPKTVSQGAPCSVLIVHTT